MNNNSLVEKINGKICWYCNCPTELVSDKDIYGPNSNFGGMYYRCILNKDHYVGTYSDNITSLGRTADKQLRKLKSKGHKIFDPLWQGEPKFFESQPKAYDWLSEKMELELKYTHFGMFTAEQCQKAIDICLLFVENKSYHI